MLIDGIRVQQGEQAAREFQRRARAVLMEVVEAALEPDAALVADRRSKAALLLLG